MLLARKFESTKTPRESLLDAYDCCLAHPKPSHSLQVTIKTNLLAELKHQAPVTQLIRSVPEFRGLFLLVRSCSCLQVKCKRSVGGCFLPHFVYPKCAGYVLRNKKQNRQ